MSRPVTETPARLRAVLFYSVRLLIIAPAAVMIQKRAILMASLTDLTPTIGVFLWVKYHAHNWRFS